MAINPEQQEAWVREATDEARRQAAWIEQAAREPEQQREWIRQNNVIYGGLIAVGLVLVQPFVTETGLNWSAKICVIAFAAAIPLLAALLLVNSQESFRRRTTDSRAVSATQSIAQSLAFVGVVAGFWHIMWVAGVAVLVSGLVAMMVHSAGYVSLEQANRDAAVPGDSGRPESVRDVGE